MIDHNEISSAAHDKVIETRRGRLFFRKPSLRAIAKMIDLDFDALSEKGQFVFHHDLIDVVGCIEHYMPKYLGAKEYYESIK